ncbi:hypothetical protein [Snuella sedimenti]|uniref:Uncharacterized protein n=1 Tax=Snuella sedimenti TaxID=2798802 RepID=A0A8J7IH11_9FLAO|nr:hypothetical protein [Snuella sedimenti]MBJ6367501.1 hypothetical protein [Snuella sedimenti]
MKYPIYFLLLFTIWSCKQNQIEGIEIGHTLYTNQSLKQNKELTDLIARIIKKDSKALEELTEFWCGGGAGCYDLGIITSEIVYKIGEDNFIKMTSKLNTKQKNNLEGLLNAGLEYGYEPDRNLNVEFPNLYKFLNTQELENLQLNKPNTFEFIDLNKIPDSLELIINKSLKGDFNGDDVVDFFSLVNNKKTNEKGVLIIHNLAFQETFIYGAGKEVHGMTNLNWIEVLEIIPKGEIVAPDLVDKETGDILGPDQTQNFKLIGNGISMSVEESHGGGILFWNGNDYQWYHIE